MNYQVIGSAVNICSDSIVIDSSGLPVCDKFLRVDHHIDNGWTNLDSVWKETIEHPQTFTKSRISNLVTNYLDPDAVISAAVISLIMEEMIKESFWSSFLCKVLYSASFWCDYQSPCPFFDNQINDLGDRLEIWFRNELDRKLGEDRSSSEASKYDRQSKIFEYLVNKVVKIFESDKIPDHIIEIDTAAYLAEIRRDLYKYVRRDMGSNDFGVSDRIGSTRRIVTRSYFPLFQQPVILRVIQKSLGIDQPKQILIGINPIIQGWQELDLLKLKESIDKADSSWNFNGRRYLIGTSGPLKSLEELVSILKNIKVAELRSAPTMWSFLHE